MHKFLRSIGFSTYQREKDIDKLLNRIVKEKNNFELLNIEGDNDYFQVVEEVSPGIGLIICGEVGEDGNMERRFYFPFLSRKNCSSNAECTIHRHSEKETFSGLLDEYKVGISLIFYLINGLEYRRIKNEKKKIGTECVSLSALSIKGKILLPIKKTKKQIESAKVANKKRNSLLEAAKNGDEDAMETLTIEDIDLYSQISRRIVKEDIYSIVDSCFMPCGVECDQYAIIGEILIIELIKNEITKEEVYVLLLESSDLKFHLCINKKDLLGEPKVGRRFKGQVWMQGLIKFSA